MIEEWTGCYGSRGDLFLPGSNVHPAKMAVQLCFRIFQRMEERGWIKPGDTILDPMCGIGTTLICGAALGYRVVGVELEKHFADWAEPNIDNLLRFNPKVIRPIVIQGDARQLAQLLENGKLKMENGAPAGVVSSPPFPEVMGHTEQQGNKCESRLSEKAIQHHKYSGVVTSPPYGDRVLPSACSAKIRNLAREGKWEEAIAEFRRMENIQLEKGQRFGRQTDETVRRRIEEAIAVDGAGYQGVVTSPPFAESEQSDGRWDSKRMIGSDTAYNSPGKSPIQIGNLKDPQHDIDAVLSSPPWENQARGGQQGWTNPEEAAKVSAQRYADGTRKGHTASAEAIKAQMLRDDAKVYGDAEGQIGNEASETYLAAMLQVYRQIHAVLKPGGVVALVTKNPIKKGKIRRLDEDTIRLMGAVGFKLIERVRAMLTEDLGEQMTLAGDAVPIRRERKSFFKRLFEKKYPHLSVDFEDVMFFQKP